MLGRVWDRRPRLASAENPACWLRGTGRRCIIGAPKAELS